MEDREFFCCDCSTEGVVLSTDEDMIYLTFWDLGTHRDSRLSIKDKIRWIFNLLKTGQPYPDGIILDTIEAEKLGKSLIKHARYFDKKINKKIQTNKDIASQF
jgi:hypothetical protein